MFSSAVDTLTATNATLVEQLSKLNDRVGETLQVERRNGELSGRVKELEGTCTDLRKELRELQSDKFALEQEVKLGTAQRLVQRKRLLVKAATAGIGGVGVVISFTLFVLACTKVLPLRAMAYFLCCGAAPSLCLLVLSARPTEARSVRVMCAYLLHELGNPLFPSPKHLFVAATGLFAAPSTCPADTPLQCATYAIAYALVFLVAVPVAIFVLPATLRRHAGSGPWYHQVLLPREDREWARREWGGLAAGVLSKALPFAIWAAVRAMATPGAQLPVHSVLSAALRSLHRSCCRCRRSAAPS